MIPELKIFFIAMSPIIELRGSIPLAIEFYGLSWQSAYAWSVLGNILPIPFIFIFLHIFSGFLSGKSGILKHFFEWLLERTRKNNAKKFERWASAALFIFVAIPLPMTGVWAGSLAAFVFGITFKKSFLFIAAGSLAAGVVVLLLTIGISNIIL